MQNPTEQTEAAPTAVPTAEFGDLESARAYLERQGDGYYLCGGVTLPYRVLPKAQSGAFSIPGRDALHTSGTEVAAFLEMHAASLDKKGISGIAYDLRVAAALIRHLDPDRDAQNGLDWNVDYATDTGMSAVCPCCGSNEVSSSVHIFGALVCDECGGYGEPRS